MNSNKKSKEYAKNTIILLLGKFCTQFISFLLLPLYTKRLEAGDFGTVDLIHTYITLLVPVLTLRLDGAAFRFLLDCRNDEKRSKAVISNILSTSFICVLATAIISIIVALFVDVPYVVITITNLIILMMSSVLLQILRGQGKTIQYAIASVITGLTTLLVNIFLIVGRNWGASSILVSASVANVLCILFVFFYAKLYRNFYFKLVDKKTTKEFLRYSVPLIPHTLSWWIVNVSDRTVINIFLGAASNGVYAVSCKISNIINSVFSIFGMSWQESASLHIDDPDRDEFFTKMINQILMLFAGVSLLIMAALPIFYNIIIGKEYWSSYDYIPVLLYSNVWSVLTGLVGGIYVAKKRTKEIANTTIVSAIINITIDLILIHFIGLHAATISTLVSCMVMAIYRMHDSKKYVKYKFDLKRFITFTVIFVLSAVAYHFNILWLNVVNLVGVCIYIFLLNRKNLKSILLSLKGKDKHEKANEKAN